MKTKSFTTLTAIRLDDCRYVCVGGYRVGEPEAERFYDLVKMAVTPKLSAVSFVELVEVFARRMEAPDPLVAAQRQIAALGVSIIAVSAEQAILASQARNIYGKGRHQADLNFGDVFVYALAKTLDEPLLFKGNDFIHTDVKRAAP